MKIESPIELDNEGEYREPNNDQVAYRQVMNTYYGSIFYFIFKLLGDQQSAKTLSKATFRELYRPMVKADQVEIFLKSLYKEAGLLAMDHLHGAAKKEEKYQENIAQLERLQIEADLLRVHAKRS